MKKSDLKLIIRKIVREEVAMAIQEVITELKQPVKTKQVSQQKTKKKIVEQKEYTNNSVLNDVLNETAMNDEWKSLGGGTYNSSRMNEVLSSQYGDLNSSEPSPEAMVASMGVNPETAPDPVKNMFTKDYRSILKKVDEKAKSTRMP